ncbi:MAG: zinc-ribbon domain-containing protein, partial [Pseudomonadota bacterium]
MRITCPRCDAEYQIPDAAIRTDGQDVQCSSCGHSWYLLPQVQQKATQAAPEETASPRAATKADRRADKLREVLDAHRNAILGNAPTEEDELIFDTAPRPRPDAPETHAMAEPPEAFSPRPSRALAPDVLSMLREEATRETKARGDGPGGAADKTDGPVTGGAATPAGAPTQPDATEPVARKPEAKAPGASAPGSAEREATAPNAEAFSTRPSRALAPDILSMLREEANREAKARGDGTGGAADKTDRPGTGGAATPAGAPTQSDAT